MDVSFSYDAMGRITGFQRQRGKGSPVENTVCTYDPMGRLLSCTAGGQQETYSFDALGNRTAWKVDGTGKATYSYDAMNRLTAMVQDGRPTATVMIKGGI